MPNISPVFTVAFMTCLTELHNSKEKWPDANLVEIINDWMLSKDQFYGVIGSSLLLGLARWTILHPLTDKTGRQDSTIAVLHLAILEILAESKIKFAVPSKSVVLLVSKVEQCLNNDHDESSQELALDRLGQFLHCLSATTNVHGKVNEVCASMKRLVQQSRILQMYLNMYQ